MAGHRMANEADVPSPALLVYPDRIAANLARMVAMVGNPARLRPHVKTHKMAEVVRMHLAVGIRKFKCATIAEAEMTAAAGADEVLLAYQPVGPNIARLRQLTEKFARTRFAALCDDDGAGVAMAAAFADAPHPLAVYLDIDCGHARTGIVPGAGAAECYARLSTLRGITMAGLHVYDGHLHDSDPSLRRKNWEAAFAPVDALRRQLGMPPMVAGGSPTFPLHAACTDRECSPGTTVLWDFGYGDKLADVPCQHAALLLTRVISRPGRNRLCLDLGYKAVSADKAPPRARLLELPDAVHVVHNEEHLVVETPRAAEFAVGACLYALPAHICPTVSLHDEAVVVREGRAAERWAVTARRRQLTV